MTRERAIERILTDLRLPADAVWRNFAERTFCRLTDNAGSCDAETLAQIEQYIRDHR